MLQLTCSGAPVRAHITAGVPFIIPLSYSKFSMVQTDYSPKTLWRLARDGHAVECILMPHAQHVGVFIRVNGQARDAASFPFHSDALRWAEEQRANISR